MNLWVNNDFHSVEQAACLWRGTATDFQSDLSYTQYTTCKNHHRDDDMTQDFMVFKQGGTQHSAHRCRTSLCGFRVSSWKPKKSTRMGGRHIGTTVSLLKNQSPSQCHIVLVLNRLPKPGICAFQLIVWWTFMIIKYLWGTITILRTLNKLKSWRIQDGREGILTMADFREVYGVLNWSIAKLETKSP